MNKKKLQKVKEIYFQLKSLLANVPKYKDYDKDLAKEYNNDIQELIEITNDKDYDKYILDKVMTAGVMGGEYLAYPKDHFVNKCSRLISMLNTKYEFEETNSNTQSAININQTQTTEVNFHMILDLQEKIINKISDENTTPKQKSFLEKVKKNLTSIKNYFQFAVMLINLGKESGLELDDLHELFN